MADKINTESKSAGIIFFKSTSCMNFHFWARYFGVALAQPTCTLWAMSLT